MGENIKAAQTNLQIAQTTKVEAWRGDSLVEAGRFYSRAGETDKARDLYKQAQTSGYGWAQGLSLYEQANLLMAEDKHEEARRVLTTPITGQYADQIQVVLVEMLGASYYRTGDWDAARRECERAIALYQALKSPLPEEGLEEHVALAQRTLALMEKWPRTPMESQPAELRITVKAGEVSQESRRVRFDLHSFRRIHITVTSDRKEVVPQVPSFERAADNGSDFSYAVGVQLAPEALRDGFTATLTVTSPEHPDFQVRVPLRVETEKPVSEKSTKTKD
jgi:tetratricopeptide (TPR) repeat protein